ncbi:hypothetical protein BV25DRAFT_486760 [Artomyces pyxidatus]|uniref:Uncharacterized protein n=1 Tax=Artomyces pyxidatus TaxID=48021 RepID=A0ACB8T4A9_9AGAM|nr:hypothetical protein BV25DRAFT_486760 [Artomyces pyxidatus]
MGRSVALDFEQGSGNLFDGNELMPPRTLPPRWPRVNMQRHQTQMNGHRRSQFKLSRTPRRSVRLGSRLFELGG